MAKKFVEASTLSLAETEAEIARIEAEVQAANAVFVAYSRGIAGSAERALRDIARLGAAARILDRMDMSMYHIQIATKKLAVRAASRAARVRRAEDALDLLECRLDDLRAHRDQLRDVAAE